MENSKKSFSREFLKSNIFTVSAYISILNGILNLCEAKIKGEVGEVKKSSAGHVYFSLKDKKDNSVLSCVIWNYDYRVCGVELEDGLEVIAEGMPDIYAPNGRISFKAKTIQLVGEGDLKKAYDKLKKKLEDEGVFNEERKRGLPSFPKRVGLITSRYGAVINDFLSNIGHYGFEIKFIDSRVEGQEAIRDLISAIRTMKAQEVDVLLIMRGGGSLESFAAFNNEALIREAVSFPAPVIAALGHDKDIPLLALAADKYVSTPTASAMLLNTNWDRAESSLREYRVMVFGYMSSLISQRMSFLQSSALRISNYFDQFLNDFRVREAYVKSVINGKMEGAFVDNMKSIEMATRIIAQNDPKRNLKLGYCIVRTSEGIVRSVDRIKKGDLVDIELYDAFMESEIKGIRKKN
ncbi:MAG: exodeoxyribonuclease VII large subunit [Minisyncoccus archaeiphilus]|uniref:exodeoxyribonuclease VII large subunit n=1 Tax=Minisyncoccus archaeiphilus TaxID=3238481 RepID=UPI002B11650E|nr:MAG: exodeoxyribonuclease VII large subunit [Candidatus Parcubacteria bacterium]